jgi:hypothetical protein
LWKRRNGTKLKDAIVRQSEGNVRGKLSKLPKLGKAVLNVKMTDSRAGMAALRRRTFSRFILSAFSNRMVKG